MRPRVNLEKRGDEWVVFLRSGCVVFGSPCYAKAVGVHDYLTERANQQRHPSWRRFCTCRDSAVSSCIWSPCRQAPPGWRRVTGEWHEYRPSKRRTRTPVE